MVSLWILLLCAVLNLLPCNSPRGRAYDNDLRHAIIYGRFVLRISSRELAAVHGIPRRTVNRYIERWRTYGTYLQDADAFGETRGRPFVITINDLRLMQDIVEEDCTRYVDEIRVIMILRGGSDLSERTVLYWIRRMGYTRQRLFHVWSV